MNASIRTILGFSLTTLVAGCGAGNGADAAESQVASDGNEGMAASAQSINMASVVFENVSIADPAKAAVQLAMPSQLWPSGCVTRAQTSQSEVTITFNDCTGPFGLVHLDGEEIVTFSAAPGGALEADIDGMSLTANGKPVTQSAIAIITFPSSTTRAVAWKGSWQRTDDLGDVVQHTSDLTISVDLSTGCSSSSGTAQTNVASREVNTTISGFQICHSTSGEEGCPSGAVDHVGVTSGKTVQIKFDGTDQADVTGPRGDTFQVPLVCVALAG